jgi:hypothetical protein
MWIISLYFSVVFVNDGSPPFPRSDRHSPEFQCHSHHAYLPSACFHFISTIHHQASCPLLVRANIDWFRNGGGGPRRTPCWQFSLDISTGRTTCSALNLAQRFSSFHRINSWPNRPSLETTVCATSCRAPKIDDIILKRSSETTLFPSTIRRMKESTFHCTVGASSVAIVFDAHWTIRRTTSELPTLEHSMGECVCGNKGECHASVLAHDVPDS